MDTTIHHYASWVDSATVEHDNKLRAHFTTAAGVKLETTGHKTGHKAATQQKASHRNRQLANVYEALR
jgi:hypothetical protein